MILVDSSVWVDHLHVPDERLLDLLDRDEVATHRMVIEELAVGSIRRRHPFLDFLQNQRTLPVASHSEFLGLVERRRLWGRGLSSVDVHLLASVLISPGATLWTRDRRLAAAASELRVAAAH